MRRMLRVLAMAVAVTGAPSLFGAVATGAGQKVDSSKVMPKLDQDKDGVSDSLDRCPNEAEIVNFFLDEDGCSDEKPNPPRNGPLSGLVFASGSESPDSTWALDTLASRLRLYPGLRIEIRGHTDNVEEPDRPALSQRRAEFVRAFLDSLGIEPERMEIRGMGAREPLVPNRSGAARMQNRRVELRVH